MSRINKNKRIMMPPRLLYYGLLLVGVGIGLGKSLLGDNSIQSWAIFGFIVIACLLGISYLSTIWLFKSSLTTHVYKTFFNQSNDAVFLLDLEGHHVTCNESAAKMLGYTVEELTKLSFRELVVENELANSEGILKSLLEGDTIALYERTFRKKNKEFLETEVNVQLVRDESDKPLYILSIVRDISDRKKTVQALRYGEERLRTFASALPDRTVILDAKGVYRDILKVNYDTIALGTNTAGRSLSDALEPDFAEYCMQKIQETLVTNQLNVVEYDVIREGKTSYFEGRIIPYFDTTIGEKLVIWISRDITERKLSEQALKNSEERLRAFASALPDRVIVLDKEGRYQNILQQRYATVHYPSGDRVGKLLHDVLDKDFADFCLSVIQKALSTQTQQIIEYERMLEGKKYFIEARIAPFKDPQTDEFQVIWVSRDITQQRLSQDALKNSEERLRTFVSILPDRAVVLDKEGRYNDILKESPDTYSYSFHSPNVLGKTLHEVLHKEYADFCYQVIQETLQSNTTRIIEYNNMNQDDMVYLEGRIAPIHDADTGETRILWISRDITKQKEAGRQLQYHNRLQSLLISLAADFINFPVEKLDAYINKLLEQIGQFIGADRSYINLVSSDTQNARIAYQWYSPNVEVIEDLLDPEQVRTIEEFVWSVNLLKNAETILIPRVADLPAEAASEKKGLELIGIQSVVTIPLFRHNSLTATMGFHAIRSERAWTEDTVNLLKIAGQIYLNALERKDAGQALSDSERQLRLLIEALPDRTLIFDENGNYQEVVKANYETENSIQISEQDLKDSAIHDIYPQEFADFCLSKIRTTLEANTVQVFEYPCPVRGTPYRFEARTIPFTEPRTMRQRVFWVTRDITERSLAEQQRLDLAIAQEKNDVLRQFVDSMTHDLKTPLSVIATSTYLLGRQKEPHRQVTLIDRIRRQADLLNQMLDDMLAIARLDYIPELEWQTLDLIPVVQDIVDILRTKAEHKHIKLNFNSSLEFLSIIASLQELRRVLTNVIDNAIKYTPDGGDVTVDVSCTDDNVIIKIKDTGIGIAQSELEQVFRRFYRTALAQETAPGTGLGLEITRRIIEFHNGKIEVESELKKGSTFIISLPLSP